jgi:hypothetical protein
VEPVLDEPPESQEDNNNNDIFAQINQMASAEGLVAGNETVRAQDAVEVNALDRASAELLLYHREPHIPTKTPDGRFTDPLDWWCVKQSQFPLLSKLAVKYLAIPATSAPSERVFSTAGITIASERAKLDPKGAGDLVFLHDAVPALKKYQSL